MGIVATDYRFLWANVGSPGSVNDACTFQASHSYSDMVKENALGDFAFPHYSWLQKPFANTVLSEKQSHFNYCLGRARMVAESAFGQLKGRWRLLYRKSVVSQHSLKMSVLACIVLHNICIEKKIASTTAWISLLTKITTKENGPKTLEET